MAKTIPKPPLNKSPGGLRTWFKRIPCWCSAHQSELVFEPAYHAAIKTIREATSDAFIFHYHGYEFFFTVARRRSDGFYVPHETKGSRRLPVAVDIALRDLDG